MRVKRHCSNPACYMKDLGVTVEEGTECVGCHQVLKSDGERLLGGSDGMGLFNGIFGSN